MKKQIFFFTLVLALLGSNVKTLKAHALVKNKTITQDQGTIQGQNQNAQQDTPQDSEQDTVQDEERAQLNIYSDTLQGEAFEEIDISCNYKVIYHKSPGYKVIYERCDSFPSKAYIEDGKLVLESRALDQTNTFNTNEKGKKTTTREWDDIYSDKDSEPGHTLQWGDDSYLDINYKKGKLSIVIDGIDIIGSNNRPQLLCHIYAPTLNAIDLSIGSILIAQDPIKTNHLTIETSSASEIIAQVETQYLSLDQSSGSSAEIRGYSEKTTIDLSSGASLQAQGLETEYADIDLSSGSSLQELLIKKMGHIEASSGSNSTISLLEDGNVDVSSGANITYYAPQKIESERSSGASITAYITSKQEIRARLEQRQE